MTKNLKNTIFLILKKNRHCLVAIFVAFVIIFTYSFDSFAQDINYWVNMPVAGGLGQYTSAGYIKDLYNLTETDGYYPTLSTNIMRSLYGGTGDLTTNGSNATGFPASNSNFDRNWVYSDQGNDYCFFKLTECSNGGNNTYDFSNSYYLGCLSTNNYSDIHNYVVQSSGNIALCIYNNALAVVSDAPIKYCLYYSISYYSAVSSFSYGDVNDADNNGFYVYGLNTYDYCMFTDLPIYLPSTDGVSGYTGTSDFSFSSNNVNFNTLVSQGIIPDGGDSPADDTGKHYNYASLDAQYIGFEDSSGYTIKTRWVLNDYIINHPEKYEVVFNNAVVCKAGTGNKRTFVRSDTIPMTSILANGNTDYQISYLFREFMDNSTNLSAFLESEWQSASGSSSGYYSNDSVISYGGTNPNSTRSFGGFKLTVGHAMSSHFQLFELNAEIYIKFVGGSIDTTSGALKTTYNFLTGDSEITDNTISTNLDPNETLPPATYNNGNLYNNGGGSGTGSVVQNNNPNIIVQSGGGLTQAFQIDDVNIAGLADTMNYIVNTLGSDRATNGFWAVMKNTYDYFPEGFWDIMLLGITTVVGISVVKVCLTTFRNK